jgi:hypothetical protein
VNTFLSMLVPLDTLPGWPDVQEPSVLDQLGLLVGAPLVVIILIAIWTRVHHAVKGNMGTPGVANQPIWVNGRRIEPAAQHDEGRASIEAGHRVVEERRKADDDESTGGAGARW